MKRTFLLLFLIVFLCVTFANTEIKAFAFGDRALKVAYDEYLHVHVLPTVYEMTDTGRVKLDDENLGIYFIWKHWYWWNQDWKYWTNYWSETLSEVSSKRMGTAIGTLLIEGGSALLGTGITMLVGDLFSLGASLPASVKAVFEAGKLVSIALGLTSAGLNTIADTLATDKEDFISVYLAMSAVEHNSLNEARELLEALEKKKNAIMLADSEIKLIDALNKITNLQASTAMMVLEPATLSTVQGLLEIIDASLLDLATVKIAPRGIKEDAEGLNLFLNASIIHLGLLVDLSSNLDDLQSEIQLAESKFDSAWMARAVMKAAAIENAYYRVMAGYIRLHLKYLQKEDSGVMNHIYDGLSVFRSFIKNVGYYLGSGEETLVTEAKPLPVPTNILPEDGESNIQILPSYNQNWVKLMWEMPDTEGRSVTYDVMAGTGRDSLTYIARDLTEKMFFYNGLQEGKEYYWKVIARDTMGNRSESQIWKFSTVKVSAFLKTPSGVEMVYVEGGTFTMGDTWGDGYDDEKPAHQVTLTYDFYIGKYETTFDEYDAFCEATGRSKPGDEGWGRGTRPVIYVIWNDAIAYCNWLSENEGFSKAYDSQGNLLDKNGRIAVDISYVEGYRLPTEAEWEYAARGGKYSKGYKYSGGDEVYFVAWYSENSGKHTHSVGTTQPNELNIFDMSGNVWEWCSDWYDGGYYAKSPTTNPYNYTPGSIRVFRGGSWFYDATSTRVANRNFSTPTYTFYDLGFRITRTVP